MIEQTNDINTLGSRIERGLQAMDISSSEKVVDRFVQYIELLAQWNQKHNLTGVDDVDAMIGRHILDSVSIKPYIKGSNILDVGSGAGLPGMMLAILIPTLEVTSIESRNKKAQFQQFAAGKLKLKNFVIENGRVEDYQPKNPFAMVVARAFSSLEELVKCSRHLIAENGRWLAMKGTMPDEELKAIKKMNLKFDTYALKVAELSAQRNLVVIKAGK